MNAPAPFPAFPTPQRFTPVGDIQPSLIRLCRSIDSYEPISAVFAPAGVGKTLLAQLLQQQYQETHRTLSLLGGSITGSLDLLQYLVDSFDRKVVGCDETTLRLKLRQCLSKEDDPRRQILLIIDNAQRLTPEAFEAIQSLTDIIINDHPRIQSCLLGTQKLEEMLIGTCSESLAQRVATRCYLHALNEAETKAYIHHTIAGFNVDPLDTITDAAISALHHSTGGTPRLINQLMTESIDLAATHEQSKIDENLVQSAWASLQQLPDPHAEKSEFVEASDIEFGELSEFGQEGSSTEKQDLRDASKVDASPKLIFELETDSPPSGELAGHCGDINPLQRKNTPSASVSRTTLPELDYPVVIQSNDELVAGYDYGSSEKDPCLESIIEEKLGVANFSLPSEKSPEDHSDSTDPNHASSLNHSIEFETDQHHAEIQSLIEEELPNAYIEQSDEDFDADAERRALISLLGESYASEVLDSRLDDPVGPVLDVDAVYDTNRNNQPTHHSPRQRPSRSQIDAKDVAPRQTPHARTGLEQASEEDTLWLDSPHGKPNRPTPTAEDVNAMLRRMRKARGA